jgi:hypothetical protein
MKIGYSKTYQLFQGGAFEKIWLEDETESNAPEEVRKALYSLKKQVESFHFESNKAAEKQVEKEIKPSDEVQAFIDSIRACTTIEELQSYWVRSKTNLVLCDEYNTKLKELKNVG